MIKILLLQGPNLNLLGTRESHLYGNTNLASLHQELIQQAQKWHYQLICQQSNAEHEIINAIHHAKAEDIKFILINPAAFTHTSIAIRDALLAVHLPFIEIHLSNIFARESFRHRSFLADIAIGGIYGFGTLSYRLALQAAHEYLSAQSI